MKLKAGIIAAGIVLLATGAMAQVSVQVGVQGGGSIASTQISQGSSTVDGIGERSSRPDLGVRAGADFRLANSPFVLGAFGEWNSQDVQFAMPGFSAALENMYALGGRAGVVFGGAMPYVGVAYARADTRYSTAVTGAPASFSGPMYLAGIEIPLGHHLSLASEARWIRYEGDTITCGGRCNTDIQPDQLQAMVRLNWNFGGPSEVSRSAPLK